MRSLSQSLDALARSIDTYYHQLTAWWDDRVNIRTTLFILLLISIAVYTYRVYLAPPDDFPSLSIVTLEEGMSSTAIGERLAQQHIVRSAYTFRIIVSILGHGQKLKAGDYEFKDPQDTISIAQAIANGRFGLEPIHVLIPEGSTVKDMALIYERKLPRFDSEAFAALAQPLEGYLFPDTYYFLPNVKEETIVNTMRQNFDSHMTPELLSEIEQSGHTLAEIVTMASIVEKEANKYTDRRMIAGVLWNRIAKGMPLQSDIPIIYVTGKGDFDLTLTDLRNPSPYNTYVHKGLPPGPVNSPSIDSMRASADPIKNNYLFYLSDLNDTTYYSSTYSEHLRYKALFLDGKH